MKILFAVLLCAPLAFCQSSHTVDSQYALEQSTLPYHMSHPMHQVDGISHAAKGKGICHAGVCDFLLPAPVKSFFTGDSTRDLHLLQGTRGAKVPMVVVRTEIPEATATSAASTMIDADLDVQFAGQTVHYARVPFQRVIKGDQVHITGIVPATCSDFKIDRPSFLTVPIKNEIPVRVDMTWKKM